MNDWGLIRLIDARAGDFQAGRFYVEFEHDVETVRYRESEEDGSDELGKRLVGVVMTELNWATDKPLLRCGLYGGSAQVEG